jgi:hypothetical protein
MDTRIIKWLTIETARWEPLEQAPAILVPSERLTEPYLSHHLDVDEMDVEPAIDDDLLCDFPWGLEDRDIISMDWGPGMCGLSGGYQILAVDVTDLGTLYVEASQDGWSLLALGRRDEAGARSSDDIDLAFLDVALRTNGSAFHTGLIGSAPHHFHTGVGDAEWLAERLGPLFDDYGVWGSLDDEIPGVCDPIEVELAELAEQAGVDLDELDAEYDARRPPEPPKGSANAMIAWTLGRESWIRAKLLESEKAREWLYRRKMQRFLEGTVGQWAAGFTDDEEERR